MLLALNHLHYFKIIHKDIKSDNIFLKQLLESKVGDLGSAKKLELTDVFNID